MCGGGVPSPVRHTLFACTERRQTTSGDCTRCPAESRSWGRTTDCRGGTTARAGRSKTKRVCESWKRVMRRLRSNWQAANAAEHLDLSSALRRVGKSWPAQDFGRRTPSTSSVSSTKTKPRPKRFTLPLRRLDESKATLVNLASAPGCRSGCAPTSRLTRCGHWRLASAAPDSSSNRKPNSERLACGWSQVAKHMIDLLSSCGPSCSIQSKLSFWTRASEVARPRRVGARRALFADSSLIGVLKSPKTKARARR
mmetsp:Transcript_4429/g.11143  ORF Transcript_4429/g.11143 Transcript_4429/m.11143 type:complete len:254 (+) Transcript_4429:612-1373(+)